MVRVPCDWDPVSCRAGGVWSGEEETQIGDTRRWIWHAAFVDARLHAAHHKQKYPSLPNGTCNVAGQRRYQDNKDAPPQVTTDAWAEAERQLQAGVGIKEVCASPGDEASTTRGGGCLSLVAQWPMVLNRCHT